MNQQQLIEALATIAEEQQNTADVTVRIGGTNNNQVEHGSLYLIDCPSRIVDALLDQGFTVSISYGAARVDKF